MTFDLEPTLREDYQTYQAHRRWYQAQSITHCRRCDRPFHNSNGDKTEYCSRDCMLGWFPPVTKKQEPPKPKPKHRGRHLPVSHYSSNWS